MHNVCSSKLIKHTKLINSPNYSEGGKAIMADSNQQWLLGSKACFQFVTCFAHTLTSIAIKSSYSSPAFCTSKNPVYNGL